MRWGLVPPYEKGKPDFWKMFNARSETLSTSPVFSRCLQQRRCAVPLDGFFEWRPDECKTVKAKQPWYVTRRSGEPLWMAGLYSNAIGGNYSGAEELAQGAETVAALETFTLITRDVDPALAWLHDRMPVILDGSGLQAWLAPHVEKPLAALGLALPTAELSWHPTTKKMSKLDYQEEDTSLPVKLMSQQQRSVASFFGAAPSVPCTPDPVPSPVGTGQRAGEGAVGTGQSAAGGAGGGGDAGRGRQPLGPNGIKSTQVKSSPGGPSGPSGAKRPATSEAEGVAQVRSGQGRSSQVKRPATSEAEREDEPITSSQVKSSQVRGTLDGFLGAKPSQVKPGRAQSSPVQSSQVRGPLDGFLGATPSQVKPVQVKTSQLAPSPERLETAMAELREMGFLDEAAMRGALESTRGDLAAAVAILC